MRTEKELNGNKKIFGYEVIVGPNEFRAAVCRAHFFPFRFASRLLLLLCVCVGTSNATPTVHNVRYWWVRIRSFHGAVVIIEILFLKAHGLVCDVHSVDCVQPDAERTNSDKIILDNVILIDNNWQRWCHEPQICTMKNEKESDVERGETRSYVSKFVSSWVAVSETEVEIQIGIGRWWCMATDRGHLPMYLISLFIILFLLI